MSKDLYYLDYSGLQTFSMPSPLHRSNIMSSDIYYSTSSWRGTITVEGRNRLRAAVKAILRQAQIDFIVKELDVLHSKSHSPGPTGAR